MLELIVIWPLLILTAVLGREVLRLYSSALEELKDRSRYEDEKDYSLAIAKAERLLFVFMYCYLLAMVGLLSLSCYITYITLL